MFSTQPYIPTAQFKKVRSKIKCESKKEKDTSVDTIYIVNLTYALYNTVVLFLEQVMHDLSLVILHDIKV
jgi:hypothetical protein